MENYQIRTIKENCRALQDDTGKKFIEGYAMLYEQRSKLLFDWFDTFYEVIQRGALDDLIADPSWDVVLTPNHNYNQVIARTTSKTLQLTNDDRGLKYRAEIPNISYALDIYESIKRGDTFESSFTFMVDDDGETWTTDPDGTTLHTILKFKRFKEIAPVTWGAYANTEVAARAEQSRSYEEFIEQKKQTEFNNDLQNHDPEIKQNPLSNYELEINLLKLKN